MTCSLAMHANENTHPLNVVRCQAKMNNIEWHWFLGWVLIEATNHMSAWQLNLTKVLEQSHCTILMIIHSDSVVDPLESVVCRWLPGNSIALTVALLWYGREKRHRQFTSRNNATLATVPTLTWNWVRIISLRILGEWLSARKLLRIDLLRNGRFNHTWMVGIGATKTTQRCNVCLEVKGCPPACWGWTARD